MAGRKTKLNDALIAKLAGYIASGLTNKDAIALSGIADRSFYRWQEKAAADTEAGRTGTLHQRFAERIEQAQPLFKGSNLKVIRNAANSPSVEKKTTTERLVDEDGNPVRTADGKAVLKQTVVETERPPTWQPAAWLLERKFPDEFGRRLEHAGRIDGDGPPARVVVTMPDNGRDPGVVKPERQPDADGEAERVH